MPVPDVYANICESSPEMQSRLAEVIESRAADPRQRAMLQSYLSEIEFAQGATVLEIGCGTGPVTRTLAGWPGVARVVGIDPSEVFIGRARELASEISNLSFIRGDGRSLPMAAETFDVIVAPTTLSHVPEPERVLAEATRVLRAGGWLAVFDGDYATASVALGTFDPLEECVRAFRANFVHDPWLVRGLPRLIAAAGLNALPMKSHGYVEAPEGGYMLTWIQRGLDVLVRQGQVSSEAAAALAEEAQRRSFEKRWFAHIAFASMWAQKPHNSDVAADKALSRCAPSGPCS
jgi:ubiquinone/menaquinone biosynthesis C-methylase UbiE